jgi:hypothetical protein
MSSAALAQELDPPVPQSLTVHSNILNEDRKVWVRLPVSLPGSDNRHPVLYITDAGENVNEIGMVIDFLSGNDFIPPLIVVGITNPDRVRDLTPTHGDVVNPDGSVEKYAHSGGANRFLDFIQNELVPEIDKRYATQPHRIIAGHSLGGLFAIHAVMSHSGLFHSAIAASPSLWWDNYCTLDEAQQFFARQKEFNKSLFFTLGNESEQGTVGFDRLQKILESSGAKGFVFASAKYPEEKHSSTELLTHYNGLRTIFKDWPMPRDLKTGYQLGGLAGIERHFHELSDRYGFPVSAEREINRYGYALLGNNKTGDAISAFKRNVELYPASPNVYDSLAEALEAEGKVDEAVANAGKAVVLATSSKDPRLPGFKKHLDQLGAVGAPKKP